MGHGIAQLFAVKGYSVWLVEDKGILRRNLTALIEEQPGMTCPVSVGRPMGLDATDGGWTSGVVLSWNPVPEAAQETCREAPSMGD